MFYKRSFRITLLHLCDELLVDRGTISDRRVLAIFQFAKTSFLTKSVNISSIRGIKAGARPLTERGGFQDGHYRIGQTSLVIA